MLHEKMIVENPMKARSFNDILKNLKNYANFLMKFAQFAFKVLRKWLNQNILNICSGLKNLTFFVDKRRSFLIFYSDFSANMKLLR